MAETAIEWTERSWNPIVGCSLATPGCTNCYAIAMAARIERMGTPPHYAGLTQPTKAGAVWTGKLALAPEHVLLEPLRRKKPTTWFVNSMGDLFHEDVPDEWIDRVFAVMALAPQHTFQVLTKRAGRMRAYMLERWQGTPARAINLGHGETLNIPAGCPTGRREQVEEACEPLLEALGLVDPTKDHLWTEQGSCKARQWQWPLPNVWLGVSAEDQRRADERIPDLLATPAAIRFVSAEPLLGPIDFRDRLKRGDDGLRDIDPLASVLLGMAEEDGTAWIRPALDWIIVGGESGPNARPMHPDWARSIRDQCAGAGTAFFFKQWGEWCPISHMSEQQTDACYRSNRIARDGMDQLTFDEVYGRTRIRPSCVLHCDGSQHEPVAPMAFLAGTGAMTMFDIGKKSAGRLLDGVEHSAMPERRL